MGALTEARGDERTDTSGIWCDARVSSSGRVANRIGAGFAGFMLGQRALRLAVQPILPVQHVPALTWFELLLRFPKDCGISVARAVESAIEAGAGAKLDLLVLKHSLRWLHQQPGVERASVNITPATLDSPRLASTVLGLLKRFEVAPGRLCLEISEHSSPRCFERSYRQLGVLRSVGVHVALDDVGGDGANNLRLLRGGVADVIKLDARLVRDAQRQPSPDYSLLDALIGFADSLGVSVVIEGVECDDGLLSRYRGARVHLQGFLLGRPTLLPNR